MHPNRYAFFLNLIIIQNQLYFIFIEGNICVCMCKRSTAISQVNRTHVRVKYHGSKIWKMLKFKERLIQGFVNLQKTNIV